MASAFSHIGVAVMLGYLNKINPLPKRFWALSFLCAILPDVDVMGFAVGIEYGDFWGHRGFTHSLCFAIALSVMLVRFAFQTEAPFTRRWWLLINHFFLVTASHGVLDAMTDGGLGVAFFAPFDNTRYFLPWTPIKVSPIGISSFFSWWGVEVVASELVWVWIPVGLFLLGMLLFRKVLGHRV